MVQIRKVKSKGAKKESCTFNRVKKGILSIYYQHETEPVQYKVVQ
jgi:hypothetical protein